MIGGEGGEMGEINILQSLLGKPEQNLKFAKNKEYSGFKNSGDDLIEYKPYFP